MLPVASKDKQNTYLLLKKHIPILTWLPSYKKNDFSNDLTAGITVGIMVIPQGMAYGMLAGLPPIYGLYASLVPMILYAFLGTSRQMVVGPAAMVSLLVAAGVTKIAIPGSGEYISLVLALSFVVGLIQWLFGLLRMGYFVNFLSRPVLSGFISAASIIIFLSQLKYLLGINSYGGHNAIGLLQGLVVHFHQMNTTTLTIGLGGIFLILLLKKIKRAIPAPLVVVLLSIALIYFDKNNFQTVQTVGTIPAGLPAFALPDLNLQKLQSLIPVIATISLIGILESIVIAKAMQARHKDYELIPNMELKALGISNMVGALFQAFPAAGSFSRTAVNDEYGAKTGIASLIAALIVGLTLLFLTPLFYYLPKAILASIIIVAVFRLIELKEPIFLWKSNRTDFWMLIITFFATLIIGIEEGILIGIFFSLLMVLYKTTRPHITVLGNIPNSVYYKNVAVVPEAIMREDILIIRPDAPLFFANINYFKERLQSLVKEKRKALRLIVFNADCMPDIDSTAVHALGDLLQYYQKEGIEVYFTGISGNVLETFHKSDLLNLVRPEYFFNNEQDAVNFFDKKMTKLEAKPSREVKNT